MSLEAKGVTKTYGAVQALKGVDITVREGEVHALLGANGAGKSTLVKILVGVESPDQGEIIDDGNELTDHSAAEAHRHRIALVSQELNLFEDLDVLSNLFLTNEATKLGVTDRRSMDTHAGSVLQRVGLDLDTRRILGTLRLGERQLVEIAKALLLQPRYLLLDEPTSALAHEETERLHAVIRDLRTQGVGIIYVSHFLAEVLDVSDVVTVVRDGHTVATSIPVAEVSLDSLVRDMLGPANDTAPDTAVGTAPDPTVGTAPDMTPDVTPRDQVDSAAASTTLADADDRLPGPTGASQATVTVSRDSSHRVDNHGIDNHRVDNHLRITDLTVRGRLRGINLELQPGEIVGVAGLEGCGVEELFAVLFGRRRPTAGQIEHTVGGKTYGRPRTTNHAVRRGVALVPADRKGEGGMLTETLTTNISTVSAGPLNRHGHLLRLKNLRRTSTQALIEVMVNPAMIDRPLHALSGGNQQRVIFAKWLITQPSLVLLDDPTRGVDVHARAEIHDLIRTMRDQGRLVLMKSSHHEELLELCDRVIVLRQGHITSHLDPATTDTHSLLAAVNQDPSDTTAAATITATEGTGGAAGTEGTEGTEGTAATPAPVAPTAAEAPR